MNLAKNKEARALVEAEVERATAPYEGILSPEKLAVVREFVRDNLLMNAGLTPLVEQLLTAPTVAKSEERELEPGTSKPGQARERGSKRG